MKLTAATSVAFLRSLATILTPALAFAVFRKQYGWRHFAIGVLSVVGLFFLCGFGGLSGFGAGEVLSLLGALAMAAALLFGERALSEISAAALSQAGIRHIGQQQYEQYPEARGFSPEQARKFLGHLLK